MVDFFATAPHYLEHLAPIWHALPERGRFFISRPLARLARFHGIPYTMARPGREGGLLVVAGYGDMRMAPTRPIVFLEHGAGQTYGDGHPSYAGGEGREQVVLFLNPSERVAEMNRARYPQAASVAIGTPKLDRWHTMMQRRREEASRWAHNPEIAGSSPVGATAGDEGPMHRERPSLTHEPEPRSTNPGPVVATSTDGSGSCRDTAGRAPGTGEHEAPGPTTATRPVVALSFHWNCTRVPEARWAFPHFMDALPALAKRFHVIGGGHPRAFKRLAAFYRRMGIEAVESHDEVMERASVYVFDNSSSGFEFASLGKPVVLMNAPWYRRDVEHGLRFWDCSSIGLQVDEPEHLADTVALALEDPQEVRQARGDVLQRVYLERDGRAAERAAFAIRKVIETWTPSGRGSDVAAIA